MGATAFPTRPVGEVAAQGRGDGRHPGRARPGISRGTSADYADSASLSSLLPIQ